MTSNSIEQNQSESIRMIQNQSAPINISINQNQHQSESIRININGIRSGNVVVNQKENLWVLA